MWGKFVQRPQCPFQSQAQVSKPSPPLQGGPMMYAKLVLPNGAATMDCRREDHPYFRPIDLHRLFYCSFVGLWYSEACLPYTDNK